MESNAVTRRALKRRQDRYDLAAYREITSAALSLVNPTPADLKEALRWRGKCADLVTDLIVLDPKVRQMAKNRGIL